MQPPRAILFSAFETSGDHNAAAVIEALRELSPTTRIYALGGRRMQAAGAELLEHSTGRAVMFLDAAAEAWRHSRRVGRLRRWLREHEIDMLVPVDSPAANWSICKAVRRLQPRAKIVHLSAPQLWAWAAWRIHKMRRLSDHVLCLNPFEPDWFERRDVAASFVGHPLFSPARRMPPIETQGLPAGQPRLALIPGSRAKEIRANWPTMLSAFMALRQRHPGLEAMVAALDAEVEARLRAMTAKRSPGGVWPDGLHVKTGAIDSVLAWCDAALVVSGTATLDVTVHRRPMVVLYNFSRLLYLLGRRIVRIKTFSLPNLIAESQGLGRITPELVPHFGAVEPVVEALDPLLGDEQARRRQAAALDRVAAAFAGIRYGTTAAERLLRIVEASSSTP